MEKAVVAHFLRKNTQFRSSFIQNQILNHIKYKPIIIYRYYSERNDGGFANYSADNIPTLNLAEFKKLDLNFRYLKKISKKDVKKIIDFLDKNSASILHFHYGSDAYIYNNVMKYSGRPSVVSFYGYDASSLKNFLFGYGRRILLNVFRNATYILAMNPDMKKDLTEVGCPVEKIIVHYYGTDVPKFFVKREYRQKIDTVFLIISSLTPKKGHIFLLKAFREVLRSNKKMKLLIYGSGGEEERIRAFIKENNLEQYVKMKGKLVYGSEEHLRVLLEADVFIHPSVTAPDGDKEGIPGAVVEAMASGLPVISTFHAGLPYVVKTDKTGILVDEWNIEGLANAILELANDYVKRRKLGIAAQEYSLKYLDLFKKEKELESIYSQILDKK